MGNDAPEKKVSIRWMLPKDMDQVLAIERASYRFPWHESDFAEHIREKNVIPLVAIRGAQVVGYVMYENRPDNVGILNLTVDPKDRRRGFGTEIVAKLRTKLAPGKKTRIEAYVRETSLDAHLFLKANGFAAEAVCKSWFRDELPDQPPETEDAYRFVLRLRQEAPLPLQSGPQTL